MNQTALALGACACGRAIDAAGSPLDGAPELRGRRVRVGLRVPEPSSRSEIVAPFWTGVRAIDGLLTFGRGARVGIFGSPGTGKSALLEAIVNGCAADAVVVALVGERGREARSWISRCDPRTTVVCATSDRNAPERVRAAVVAASQATALRERGLDVLFVLDSLARFACALREQAVAAGESTGRAGFPPSVFAAMARLVEVAGALPRGCLTLLATVLNDGDDRDPVSEAARALLDGHITLSDRLAREGRFPAIDVPASASRTMASVVSGKRRAAATAVRSALAALDRTSDARALGIEPSDPVVLAAIKAHHKLERFLRQRDERADPAVTEALLFDLVGDLPPANEYQ
jgi:ATP synthase in type III secretion protein N